MTTTTNRESMDVSGESVTNTEVSSKKISHRVFVAEITDSIVWGLDSMDFNKVILNLDQRIINIGRGAASENEQRIYWSNTTSNFVRRLLPARSEVITTSNRSKPGRLQKLEPASVTITAFFLGRHSSRLRRITIPPKLADNTAYNTQRR